MKEIKYPIYPEISGGAVVYKITESKQIEVLLIRRKAIGDITIPKGHHIQGETLQECVIREVNEETGWRIKLESFIDNMAYQAVNKDKQKVYWRNVYWFKARAIKKINEVMDKHEIDKVFWENSNNVLDKMTRDNERIIVQKAICQI